MMNEEATRIDDEQNSNRVKDKSAARENAAKEKFVVKKGKGAPLKDICNVVSELEEKGHSFLSALHCILYGELEDVEDFRKDILEFSGFVLDNDEEGQRDKVKERLDKCTRDMLTKMCSVFGISLSSAIYTMNKKEIIDVLLHFLESPCSATEEDKSTDGEIPTKKRKVMVPEKLHLEMDTSTCVEIVHEQDEEENKEEDNCPPINESEEMWGLEKEENKKSEKSKDKDVSLPKKVPDMNEGLRGDAFSSTVEFTKSIWELEKLNKKKKYTGRRVAQEGNKQPNEWCNPSYNEVQKAISIILKEMDIITATFSDVLEELDEHFEMDMSPRKDAIMLMIEELLYRLADENQEQNSHDENQEERTKQKRDRNENKNCLQVPGGVPVQI